MITIISLNLQIKTLFHIRFIKLDSLKREKTNTDNDNNNNNNNNDNNSNYS